MSVAKWWREALEHCACDPRFRPEYRCRRHGVARCDPVALIARARALEHQCSRVLVADPPWKFDDKIQGEGRGAEKHYQCMTLEDLKSFELPRLADDCYLFMWRVAAMVPDAYALIDAWGFKSKTELVWRKRTKHGKRHFGMGHYVRAEHEVCVIATRGRPKVKNHSTRSIIDGTTGRHSAKPAEFYELVESLCSGPYVELFARQHRPGWLCYGNELGEI